MLDIVIHGPMGSGKTTLAAKLREALPNEQFRILTSLEPVKEIDLKKGRLIEELSSTQAKKLYSKGN